MGSGFGEWLRGRRAVDRAIAALAVAALVLGLPVGSAGLAAPEWTPPAWTAPAPPEISAKAAFVYDATAKVPLLAKNADAPLPPASVTKIATALVVLRYGALDDVVEILPGDVVDDQQSRVGLVAGDRMSVRDLLYGLLIPSGNDAALALARHVGASLPGGDADPQAAFVAEMNRIAAELGATATTFENPVGLDGANHRTSARDLALMTVAAMEDPLFAEIVATPRVVLPSVLRPEGYDVPTTNDMLIDGSAIGVKTGTTSDAGGCVVIASRVAGNLIVAVVLGSETVFNEAGVLTSPARFADARGMMAAIEQEYAWIDPSQPGAVPGLPEELAAWGAALPAAGAVPVPNDRAGDLGYRLELGPPADPGAPVGTVLFLVGAEMLTQQPVQQAGVAGIPAA